MSQNKHKQEYRVGTGATSMLMIFIVLCLTTLSILSYSSARADLAITKRNVEMNEKSNEAVCAAQRIIAEIDGQLVAARAQTDDDDEYADLVSLISVDDVEINADESMELSFLVNAGYDRWLDVTMQITPLWDTSTRYYLVRHVLSFDDDSWEPDFGDFMLFQ